MGTHATELSDEEFLEVRHHGDESLQMIGSRVDTRYGCGVLESDRADGSFVVKMNFGIGYLFPGVVTFPSVAHKAVTGDAPSDPMSDHTPLSSDKLEPTASKKIQEAEVVIPGMAQNGQTPPMTNQVHEVVVMPPVSPDK